MKSYNVAGAVIKYSIYTCDACSVCFLFLIPVADPSPVLNKTVMSLLVFPLFTIKNLTVPAPSLTIYDVGTNST